MNDELTLKIGGKLISGWDQVRVTRSIERLPSDFDLSLMDLYPGSDNQQWVNPGDPCVVMLGQDVVVTGYIDRWAPMISKTRHEVRATGRSKCQDLVDCSAEWPNNVISQSTALQIAQKLAAPYGVSVATDVTDLDIVPQFTLNWGESSQEVIDRITRWAALLYYDLPDGSLYLTRVGTRKAASGVAQGTNIEKATFNSGIDERFSDYIGVSMSVSQLQEQVQDAGYGSVTLARSRDPEAARMRYRNRIIIVESTMKAAQLAQRCIDWEMNRRYGRSKELLVTVDSWRDKDGKLWEPNTLIPIDVPVFGLKDELWLLAEVTYLKDDYGTTAQMVLMPPAAFTVQPYQFYSNLMEIAH
ncbi:phage baseplate assembly protein [Yersinia ruckeri]|uniref:phage baseplate assembly protein n=1 Tax=Yersinia ruckeri TaxID=29486 RepID=UPI0020BDCD5A|nr:contractile injection system protein, VgrG/Pvc8 family [Yersinia ruckeri]EKN4696981.1 phage tail protein [Yersinia ruckeri]MCK8573081.1 phage tail protein [Yersinia ruckeri]MCK8579794.1 phage tail protein [Yersinia ruckeri]MCK8582556.1 phage tail protein [Yersinia ruckeri]UZX52929.1 contractile injection system protein, VgrG/Pvc8 family [Yersinia ruckeri]